MSTSGKIRSVITAISVFLTIAVVIGSTVADYYAAQINSYFGCKTYEIVQDPFADMDDSQYYKPMFANEDGTADKEALYEYDKAVARETNNEGAVLLWNNNNALPIDKSETVNLFGGRSTKYYFVTDGSGGTRRSEDPTLLDAFKKQGFTVNETLWNFYSANSSHGGTGSINETAWGALDAATLNSVNGVGIYIIGRKGSEGCDLYTAGSDGEGGNLTALSQAEKDHLNNLVAMKNSGKLSKVIVLLNTVSMGVQFDVLSQYQDSIDACMWVGLGGTSGPDSIVDLVGGAAVPSGRLSDTFLLNNFAAPAMVNFGNYDFANMTSFKGNSIFDKLISAQGGTDSTEKNLKYIVYQEGIYIGYKYFETRYEDLVLGQGNAGSIAGTIGTNQWRYEDYVAYPFGYGLSYTTFSQTVMGWEVTDSEYIVSVKVKNTGTQYSGKEVVQVYLQKPYTEYDRITGVEQASVNFVGFAKTDILAPGEEQIVEVKVDKYDLLTYDANGAKTYITEGGEYFLAVGNNAHDALNNILAEKAKTNSKIDINNIVDENGNKVSAKPENVYKFNLVADYSPAISQYTGNEITNRFDDADLNKTDYGSTVTYLSRSDWEATYPKNPVVVELTERLLEALDYGVSWEEDESLSIPEYGKDNGLTLFSLWKDLEGNEVPYDHELWDQLLDQMTYEEQAYIICNAWCATQAATSVMLPSTENRDGPAGLNYLPAAPVIGLGMCYPSENIIASTFNVELAYKIGVCLGEDNLACGFTFLYAPGNNIHRTAFSGRNGEYFSEDGILANYMCEAEVKGLQSNGGGAQIKHFALNDQEINRNGVAIWANEQAIREIYLEAYEYACAAGRGEALSVMTGFNRVGADWAGAHYGLCTEILRDEWGFLGFTQSDGNGYKLMSNYVDGIRAGNDTFMCGGGKYALDAYKDSPVITNAMRESTKRVLYAVSRTNAMNGISASSWIVPLTPWWRIAIDQIMFCAFALTGVCLIANVVAFFRKRKG